MIFELCCFCEDLKKNSVASCLQLSFSVLASHQVGSLVVLSRKGTLTMITVIVSMVLHEY